MALEEPTNQEFIQYYLNLGGFSLAVHSITPCISADDALINDQMLLLTDRQDFRIDKTQL